MAPATWKTGTISVPTSGTTAITGLGGTPKAVFFFGTNWTAEDSVVTSSGTGIFRGMAAPDYSNPSAIVQSSSSLIPAGDAMFMLGERAINMIDTSASLSFAYIGDFVSFDADGFTVGWFASATGYKVVYVALMDVANVGAFRGITNQTALGFGFKAGASLMHGVFGTGDADGNVANSTLTQNFYGGGAYPGASASGWMGAGLTAFTFPPASAQYNIGIYNFLPNVEVAQGGHFLGPFLIVSNILTYPSGTDMVFNGDADDSGMVVGWDDEDTATGRLTPGASTGNTVTVSGLPFAPGLVIGYSISDEPQGGSSGGVSHGAAGFSVATKTFQWTALVDGVDRGAFQSFQRGVADVVHNSNVHAGTIELTTDGFVVTTEEDDVSPASWVWHAFGHPDHGTIWLPHVYRMVMFDGGIGTAREVTGDLLLENGDKIELEEGGGVLLL